MLNQSLGKTSKQWTKRWPGLSLDFLKRGLKRRLPSCSRPAKLNKLWKPFVFSVLLLDENSDMAPSPADEVQLLQPCLGKRNLTMPDDLTHSEVSSLWHSKAQQRNANLE